MDTNRKSKRTAVSERMLATLSPEAGWLLLHLRMRSAYPRHHATGAAGVMISCDEMARITRIGKGRVKELLDQLVAGGWITARQGRGAARTVIGCILQPEDRRSPGQVTPVADGSNLVARSYSSIRQARSAAAGPLPTAKEWDRLKAKYGNRCLACGWPEQPDELLTYDHIVPLVKGGSNNISNLQPLCNTCNRRKWTRTIDYRPHLGGKAEAADNLGNGKSPKEVARL